MKLKKRKLSKKLRKYTNNINGTDVRAEIRTTIDTPEWSKQYENPLAANSFVIDED